MTTALIFFCRFCLFSISALTLTGSSAFAAPRTVHVFVALCDNENQGIVPVPAALGNGVDPARNLYWGAAFGVKTFFRRSNSWQLAATLPNPKAGVLERLVFKHRTADVWLIADAYRGDNIRMAINDFLRSTAGLDAEEVPVQFSGSTISIQSSGGADLIAYIGHNGLMDFRLPANPNGADGRRREAILLACASKPYFTSAIREAGAFPLLWTTGLMAPEAYTLHDALEGWVLGETPDQIRTRAAGAYARFQKISARAALRLLVTGW